MQDEVSCYLQNKHHQTDKNPTEAKQSVKRIGTRVDQLQQTVNEMLSHEIHCSIVLRILKLDHLSLKTQSLQLLLAKTPDFYFQLSQDRQRAMVVLFTPLLQEGITYLTAKAVLKDLAKNEDKQKFVIALMAMFSKTASMFWIPEMRQATVELVLKYFEKQAEYPLTVCTQLVLSSTQIFEVY